MGLRELCGLLIFGFLRSEKTLIRDDLGVFGPSRVWTCSFRHKYDNELSGIFLPHELHFSKIFIEKPISTAMYYAMIHTTHLEDGL